MKIPFTRWQVIFGVVAIALLTVLSYTPSITGGFLWDDDAYVSQNDTLHGPTGLADIWTLHERETREGKTYLGSHTPQFYPLVFTTFWLEARLWGTESPTGFHLVNVFLHIMNALLVWMICHRLGFAWGMVAGAVFALHPVEVESVAWITERKNVLSGLCYLLAIVAWLRFDATRQPRFYAAAFGCFVLALLSKTVTCSLPVIIWLLCWYQRGRISRAELLGMIPFFATGLVFGLFTAYLERHQVGASGTEWAIAFWQRCIIAGQALFFYFSKLLYPTELTFIYPRWSPEEFAMWQLLSPILAVGITVTLWLQRARLGRGPLVAWVAFAVTLAPALGFVDVYPFRFSFVADHFQYLASLFAILLTVGTVATIVQRIRVADTARTVRFALSGGVAITLAAVTFAQASIYRDLETLWTDTLDKNPQAWIAWNNRGKVYLDAGDLDRAIHDFDRCLEVRPGMALALGNRGQAYLAQGDYQSAIKDLDRAIARMGWLPEHFNNRAIARSRLGKHGAAIRDFDRAIELDPDYARAHYNRGGSNLALEAFSAAAKDFGRAVELRPGYANGYLPLVIALHRLGDVQQARLMAERAAALGPAGYESLRRLAWNLATHPEGRLRNGTQAVEIAAKLCERTGYQIATYMDTLAAAQAENAAFDRATITARKAVELTRGTNRPEILAAVQQRLNSFRARQPWRTTSSATATPPPKR